MHCITPDHREAVAALLDGRVPLKAQDRILLAAALRGHAKPRPEARIALRDLLARAQFRLALAETRR